MTHVPLMADTVEKLDILMRALYREDISLSDFLYLSINLDKYRLDV